MMDQQKLNVLYSSVYDAVKAVFPNLLKTADNPPAETKLLCEASAYLMHEMSGPQTGRADALGCLFNHLNGNDKEYSYPAAAADELTFPQSQTAQQDTELIAAKAFQDLRTPQNDDEMNLLLERMEQYLSYLPDLAEKELSLFDTAKLNAATVSVLYDSIATGVLKEEALKNPSALMQEELFLLFSFDVSGIQNFIYTISSKGVLKGLRARSFYLEMCMEVIVDELLRRLQLSRANLIYSGGGHAYILLANTEQTLSVLDDFKAELRKWFLEHFKTSLYLASGTCSCSASSLSNQPAGSYCDVFRSVSQKVSEQKLHRYSPAEILMLNSVHGLHERECRICHRSDRLSASDLCTVCRSLNDFSSDLISKQYFVIHSSPITQDHVLPLPFGYVLTAENEQSIRLDENVVRIYCKNQFAPSDIPAIPFWLGDYAYAQTFEELAEREDEGIKRLGVLRADVDNLGHAFIAGFSADYMSLPRAAAFSRSLSMFFRKHVNTILMNGRFHLNGSTQIKPRKAAVIYAGGDDVFVVGAWDDIIGYAIDLHDTLSAYSLDALHISGGIGMFSPKYPIASMAHETGSLEEYSKMVQDKNALTLFDESNCYQWDALLNHVIDEKMSLLTEYFLHYGNQNESHDGVQRGNSMLYKMLTLIRATNHEDRLNVARFAYYLARLRPVEPKNPNLYQKEQYESDMKSYRNFSNHLYDWIQDQEERRKLVTAIQLYVYLHRNSKTKEEQ